MTKSVPAFLLLSLMAGALFAQNQPQPLTSVALWKVAPAKEADFVAKAKAFNPVLDKLLADGSILAYGMDVDMLHVPGNTNVAHWYTASNWAGIQAAETAIDAFISANPQVMAELNAMHDASAHRDIIVRSLEHKFKKPASGMPVWDFYQDTVKDGMAREYVAAFRLYTKPVLEKLFADGVICGYQLDAEAIHTQEAGVYWGIICMPNLGARDKVMAAFDADDAKRSAAERDMLTKQHQAMVTRAGHRDMLSKGVILNGK